MQKTDFNRDWTVQKDGSTEILHVNLPDDAMIREERSKENKTASASAYFAGGKYIYTKIFNLSEDETRQTLILEFEAVYQNAIVFLNGRQVAEHPYGYTNFFVDITGKVIAGTNELKVVADNADVPNSRWYSGSGIYREVHLYRSGSSYIRPEGLKVQIVDLNTIHIFADAIMQPNEKIVLEIFSDSGKIASAEGTDVTITIPDAHLWSFEDPYLYTCQATLLQGETVIDTAKSSFGIRTLSWGKDGFLVNNNPVLFRGAAEVIGGALRPAGGNVPGIAQEAVLQFLRVRVLQTAQNAVSSGDIDFIFLAQIFCNQRLEEDQAARAVRDCMEKLHSNASAVNQHTESAFAYIIKRDVDKRITFILFDGRGFRDLLEIVPEHTSAQPDSDGRKTPHCHIQCRAQHAQIDVFRQRGR